MSDQEQTDAMANILGKLNAASSGQSIERANADDNEISAMADVLRKLQNATNQTATNVVTESKTNPDLAAAVQTTRTETGVSVLHYDIRTERKTIQEGLNKTFYTIYDNDEGRVVFEDIGLFESAMGIVKHLLFTDNDQKMQRLVDLDQEYVGAMVETYSYKHRMKQLNENSVKYDVASAKYSNARSRMSAAKIKILKAM